MLTHFWDILINVNLKEKERTDADPFHLRTEIKRTHSLYTCWAETQKARKSLHLSLEKSGLMMMKIPRRHSSYTCPNTPKAVHNWVGICTDPGAKDAINTIRLAIRYRRSLLYEAEIVTLLVRSVYFFTYLSFFIYLLFFFYLFIFPITIWRPVLCAASLFQQDDAFPSSSMTAQHTSTPLLFPIRAPNPPPRGSSR